MGTEFKTGWDQPIRGYTGNAPYLGSFRQTDVLYAIGKATSKSWYGFADQMLKAACEVGGPTVTIEQGPHQPESMAPYGGGGFCLHVTARHQGYAYHLYMQQEPATGYLKIIDITG